MFKSSRPIKISLTLCVWRCVTVYSVYCLIITYHSISTNTIVTVEFTFYSILKFWAQSHYTSVSNYIQCIIFVLHVLYGICITMHIYNYAIGIKSNHPNNNNNENNNKKSSFCFRHTCAKWYLRICRPKGCDESGHLIISPENRQKQH